MNIRIFFKNFGLLESLVSAAFLYVVIMLIWTATTRTAVQQKASAIKSNHEKVVNFLNSQISECGQDLNSKTKWGEICKDDWSARVIVKYLNKEINLKNPYSIKVNLIQAVNDPRISAEGKAGQSTDKGIIFVSSTNFSSEVGSEWIIGTCVKSPCVAAGNNELISIYR